MNVSLRACAGVLAALMSCSVAAGNDVSIYGEGNVLCGKWTSDRKGSAVSVEGVLAQQDLAWVLGWLSAEGEDMASNQAKVKLRETDSNAVAHWLDDFCRAHPLDHLYDAAIALDYALAEPK